MMERTFAFVPLAAMCLVNYVPRSVGFLRERFGGGVRGTTFPGPYVPLLQYSGVCFLNKHPCGVMPTTSLMTPAF